MRVSSAQRPLNSTPIIIIDQGPPPYFDGCDHCGGRAAGRSRTTRDVHLAPQVRASGCPGRCDEQEMGNWSDACRDGMFRMDGLYIQESACSIWMHLQLSLF